MLPILQVGPLAIQFPGLLLLAGVWIGSWLIDREAPRHKLPSGVLSNLVFIGLVVGLLGARLWYAARFASVYIENPTGLFSLNPSTLAPVEGALTGLVAMVVYGQRKQLPFWRTMDALALGLAALAIAVGLANIASGDAFGAPADVPWAIDLWGARRHPTQIYEVLLAVAVFFAIWRLRQKSLAPGILFLAWLSLAAASRLFLEAFRGDSVIVFDALRLPQLLGLAILLAAMAGIQLRARKA
ncbi:MAG: prolipoprotein diacylglyceryl transferase [Anaerolineae bacterium]|nr:MAG: prolipoprotein diacylglyceryl transferase [Anaerolineae bacterium]